MQGKQKALHKVAQRFSLKIPAFQSLKGVGITIHRYRSIPVENQITIQCFDVAVGKKTSIKWMLLIKLWCWMICFANNVRQPLCRWLKQSNNWLKGRLGGQKGLNLFRIKLKSIFPIQPTLACSIQANFPESNGALSRSSFLAVTWSWPVLLTWFFTPGSGEHYYSEKFKRDFPNARIIGGRQAIRP